MATVFSIGSALYCPRWRGTSSQDESAAFQVCDAVMLNDHGEVGFESRCPSIPDVRRFRKAQETEVEGLDAVVEVFAWMPQFFFFVKTSWWHDEMNKKPN